MGSDAGVYVAIYIFFKDLFRKEQLEIQKKSLREKYPNTEFFWSVFFRIWNE